MRFDKYEKMGAYHWDWYNDPDYAWYKACVDRVVDFCQGSTLDVGCGDGLLSSIIAREFPVTGIDSDPTGIKLAKEEAPKPDFQLKEIEPQGYSEWEYMACLNVIEHLPDPKPILDIFKQNITKAGIVITDLATGKLGRYHQKEYTLNGLQDLFQDFNPEPFEIESTEFGKPVTFIGVEIYK